MEKHDFVMMRGGGVFGPMQIFTIVTSDNKSQKLDGKTIPLLIMSIQF
jgi:hypothetical protein